MESKIQTVGIRISLRNRSQIYLITSIRGTEGFDLRKKTWGGGVKSRDTLPLMGQLEWVNTAISCRGEGHYSLPTILLSAIFARKTASFCF